MEIKKETLKLFGTKENAKKESEANVKEIRKSFSPPAWALRLALVLSLLSVGLSILSMYISAMR